MWAVKKSAIQRVSKFPLAVAAENQFAISNSHQLDIADGLKELLLNKNYDLNFLLQSEPSSLATELGIDEYVVKLDSGDVISLFMQRKNKRKRTNSIL